MKDLVGSQLGLHRSRQEVSASQATKACGCSTLKAVLRPGPRSSRKQASETAKLHGSVFQRGLCENETVAEQNREP